MQLAKRTDLIVLVMVKSFPGYDSAKSKLPTQMKVEILETLKGLTKTDSIIVFGQDGVNCLEWLNKFKIGNYYVLSLYLNHNRDSLTNNFQAFNLSTCGDYWTFFDKTTVKGVITKIRTKTFAKRLRKLNNRISTALNNEDEERTKRLRGRKQALYDKLNETMDYELFKNKLGRYILSSS